MKTKVYIVTTIISYLTAWPSRDIVIAGHQQITRQWWDAADARFDLVASQLVIDEASAGNGFECPGSNNFKGVRPIICHPPGLVIG